MKTEAKFDLSVVGELNVDLVLYGLPTTFELDREHRIATPVVLSAGSAAAARRSLWCERRRMPSRE